MEDNVQNLANEAAAQVTISSLNHQNKSVPRRFCIYKKSNSGQPTDTTRRHYFNIKNDIKLLTIVLQTNPFANYEKWHDVIAHLHAEQFICSTRQCKDRLKYLIEMFTSQTLDRINKTGTEEEWEERATLISRVIIAKQATEGQYKINYEDLNLTSDDTAPISLLADSTPCVVPECDYTVPASMSTGGGSSSFVEAEVNSVKLDNTPKSKVRKKSDCIEEVLLKKAKLDHIFLMAKLEKETELEKKRLELDEKRLKLQEKEQDNQSKLLDMNRTLLGLLKSQLNC